MTISHAAACRVIVYRSAPMRLSRAIALAILAATLSLAQTKQAMDEEYARLVKEWTTSPEFMSPLVDHLPKAPGVPTVKDVLGYYAGAPKKLTKVAELGKYYRALAAASKRVKLLPIGATDEGRECLVVAIADEETIRNLDTRSEEHTSELQSPCNLV